MEIILAVVIVLVAGYFGWSFVKMFFKAMWWLFTTGFKFLLGALFLLLLIAAFTGKC
ncbi:MAG: hypothetical protein AAB932_03710 [Patescibacteria group bacterium]